ncbi:MAG TPA: 50S ribosomal protein L3 [Bacillota bacterium]|nr:50S ribosomal protein L3 [Bacillota bacterium]
MTAGIVGRKLGMTQVYDDKGRVVPVTVIQAGPCVVVQKKTLESDGYNAVQLGFGSVRPQRVNQPLRGHFQRAGVEPVRILMEFRTDGPPPYEPGQRILADSFKPGERVDVTGVSKGKGFAGSVRRHGFRRGPMAHGSKYHRGPGSLQSRAAARVFKGRKLPGHLGARRTTIQGLLVVRADAGRNLLLVRGAVPGPRGQWLTIRRAVKGQS